MKRLLTSSLVVLLACTGVYGRTLNLSRDLLGWIEPYSTPGTCLPAVPGAGTTLGPFACRAFFNVNNQAVGIEQPASTIALPAANGTYCLGVHANPSVPVVGWTRPSRGSHYIYQTCTQPDRSDPEIYNYGIAVVAGGNVTTINDFRRLTPTPVHPFDIRLYGAIPGDGGDDAPAIQAAASAASQELSDVNVDSARGLQPTTEIYAPPGVYNVGSTIQMGVASLRGAGRFQSMFEGAGIVLFEWSGVSTFSVRDVGFRTNAPAVSTTHLRMENTFYFHVEKVSSGALKPAAGITENHTNGIVLEATGAAPSVPPVGDAVIRDYLYTSTPPNTVAGFAGITIRGTLTNGYHGGVLITGTMNLEEAGVGLLIENASNVRYLAGGSIQGNLTNIQLINGDNNIFIGTNMNAVHAPGTDNFSIDSNSFDNVIIGPSFFAPTSFGTDNGVRTVKLFTGDAELIGTQGPTEFYSTQSTTGSQGVVDVTKLTAFNTNGLVVRVAEQPTGGDLALFKTERGGWASDIWSADINGVEVLELSPAGVLLPKGGAIITQGGTAPGGPASVFTVDRLGNATNIMTASINGIPVWSIDLNGFMSNRVQTLAQLNAAAVAAGAQAVCSDCASGTSPCAGAGPGTFAVFVGGNWVCP